MEDHTPIVMDNFYGHYDRGVSDDVPQDYFRDTLNLQFTSSEVSSRDGSKLSISLNNIVRVFPYKRLNENPRYLILNTSGQIFDSIVSLVTPIFTDASWVDFSVFSWNNLAYITGHNRVNGISGKVLQVYDGSTVRPAGGAAPSGFNLIAANSSNAGNVEAGFRLFALAFETSSGFITPLGPSIFAQYTAPGGKAVNISSIQTGGTGTVARRLVCTKVIPNYNGNQEGYTFYFIPTGRIADNTTNTVELSFFDADLVEDASYLFDQFGTIPCGLGLCDYNGRIALWGVPGSEHIVFLSKSGEPESFDQINGFIVVRPSDNQSGIMGCWSHRGTLFARKKSSTYQTLDNQQDPVTWKPNRIDKGIGGELFGGCRVLDEDGTSGDKYFVAHLSGLYVFGAAYQKPDISYNINNVWKRINKTKFNLVQVVHDPNKYCIYVSVPLDSASVISNILYCDYSEAIDALGYIDPKKCKWSIWQFPTNLSCILVDFDQVTNESVFKYSLVSGSVYQIDDTMSTDFNNSIHAYGALYLIGSQDESISHFGGAKIRAIGSGTLLLNATDEDGGKSITIPPLTLAASPGRPLFREFNYSAERMSLKVEVNNSDDWFTITRIAVFVNKEAEERPQDS